VSDAAPSLEALRGLHAELPVAFDSLVMLAMGGALGAALSIGAAVLLRPWLLRRRAVRRTALEALDRARNLPAEERLIAQATLLRHVATAVGEVPHLRGTNWLTHLDALFATDFFSAGAGRCFGDALYQPVPLPDMDAVELGLRRHVARLKQ